jgi:hypothetical protein
MEIKTSGAGSFVRRVRSLREAVADPKELMEEGERILFEDNERRLLDGLDVFDQPMPATLREQGIGGRWVTIKGRPVLVEPDPNPPAGKPLIPHTRASRWITLAQTGHEHRPPNEWAAYLGWPGFTSDDGTEIPKYHREGKGRLPRRDQSSQTSPTANRRWQQAFRDWIDSIRR